MVICLRRLDRKTSISMKLETYNNLVSLKRVRVGKKKGENWDDFFKRNGWISNGNASK